MNPLVVVRTETLLRHKDEGPIPVGRGLWIWCPGCEEAHRPRAANEDGSRPADGPYWDWNEREDDGFTISPSLLTWGKGRVGASNEGQDTRCHSFIRDGQWQFLGDCTHQLAGQTVPMVPVPDWLVR